jgi:hypothetical protein
MTKAAELLLELWLLRQRYSTADIEHVADVGDILNDPDLSRLVKAMQRLDAPSPAPSRRSGRRAVRKPRQSTGVQAQGNADVRKAIAFFAAQLSSRKLLRTQDQIEKFAQLLGISHVYGDRNEWVEAIRAGLDQLPSERAMEVMRGAGLISKSGSDPYVDLANTLMKQQ